MRHGFIRVSMIVGIAGLVGASPTAAQEKRGLDPMVIAETNQVAMDPSSSAEIRELHREMERLQQRIEQLEQRPVAEAHPPSSSLVTSPSMSVSGDNAL